MRRIWVIHWIDAIGGANGTPWWWYIRGELCWCSTDFWYYSYCRKATGWELFVPARTLIVVKLLIVVIDLFMQLVDSISWVEGPCCAFLTLASGSDFHNATTRFFTPTIDDHGICRGNTWWMLARWWRPVAYRVALDLPYWAMRSAPYRLIRMATKMARVAGQFFSVIDFMSCTTIAKRPCYGLLKIKPSYNIVHHYV